jgi:16S rRNA (guanine966-N2)-methyltransferase
MILAKKGKIYNRRIYDKRRRAVRVISGTARGKRLQAPRGMDTRPITDMIKEALFNVIGSSIKGASLLDLFAGSGSVGIEALSRGARLTIFIDNSNDAIRVIKKNLKNCGFKDGFEVYRNDVFRALEILAKRNARFDYIYVDPPFTVEAIFEPLLKTLDRLPLLAPNGRIIIRTPRRMHLAAELKSLEEYRVNNYGESTLHYYMMIPEE